MTADEPTARRDTGNPPQHCAAGRAGRLGTTGLGAIGGRRFRRCRHQLLARACTGATDVRGTPAAGHGTRSEEHTSELQSLMRISYAVFCLKKKTKQIKSKNE